jgi:DNA-binding NarL/FixJ family response regulator
MKITIVTSVRLLGEGLAASLANRGDVEVQAIVYDLADLHAKLERELPDVVLIDVTQDVYPERVRSIASAFPNLPLVALGLAEQRQDVIRCGRAGFSGYIGRDADVDALYAAMWDVIAGRLACPAEISGGLLRALFRQGTPRPEQADACLTRRERDVLQELERGLSNKEIARELTLSVATVKHHVHNILDKLNLTRRAEAIRHARDRSSLAAEGSDIGTSDRPARTGK